MNRQQRNYRLTKDTLDKLETLQDLHTKATGFDVTQTEIVEKAIDEYFTNVSKRSIEKE